MTALWIIYQSLVIFCTAWISLGEPQTKGKIDNNIQTGRIQHVTTAVLEKCVGNCSAGGKECTKPCDHPFRGTTTLVCPRGWWQRSMETCASLDVPSLLQKINNQRIISGQQTSSSSSHYPTKVGKEGSSCIKGFSCIIGDVLQAKPVAGNIVNIVKVLKYISSQRPGVYPADELQVLQDYTKMASHILNASVLHNWTLVSEKNASSALLESVILFARKLQIRSNLLNVSDPFIAAKGARISKSTPEKSFVFSLKFNNSESRLNGTVLLPRDGLRLLPSDSQAVSIAFPTLGPILEKTLLKNVSVNGMVLSVLLPKELKEVTFKFEKMNKTVGALCAAWHSAELRWDQAPCELQEESPATATCRCSPQPPLFQSFSILMSPAGVKNSTALNFITCVGLVVSVCSLVLCLGIEALIWRQVTLTQISYMRHTCLVNIAVSLLVADVLFLGAAFANGMPRDHDRCVAAAFFVHLFYLSLFFWMLALGLLILYGLLVIFWHLSKSTLLAVAFGIGYGCPSVIALLTVMITEPRKGYLRKDACWLNWEDTKALLAFIIPALLIIGANMVVVAVVIARSGRSSVRGHSESTDLVTVIRVSKNVVLLTPLLGITWGIGLAVVYDDSLALHIVFSLLNAFQGFFILLFGTLLDRKTRESLQTKFFPSKTPSPDATKRSAEMINEL